MKSDSSCLLPRNDCEYGAKNRDNIKYMREVENFPWRSLIQSRFSSNSQMRNFEILTLTLSRNTDCILISYSNKHAEKMNIPTYVAIKLIEFLKINFQFFNALSLPHLISKLHWSCNGKMQDWLNSAQAHCVTLIALEIINICVFFYNRLPFLFLYCFFF